jgi:hypothetical protein
LRHGNAVKRARQRAETQRRARAENAALRQPGALQSSKTHLAQRRTATHTPPCNAHGSATSRRFSAARQHRSICPAGTAINLLKTFIFVSSAFGRACVMDKVMLSVLD